MEAEDALKISITQSAPDAYTLILGEMDIALTGHDLRELLLEITRVLMPDAARSDAEHTRDFIRQIKTANDVGIQKLLRVAREDDILVLLKIAENDEALLGKFYSNMSERSRQIFAEDLSYKFKDEVPEAKVSAAIGHLIVAARQLEDEGALVYAAAG